MKRILLLDDEVNVLHALQRTIKLMQGLDLRMELFTDPQQALQRSAEIGFDIVMSDFRMPAMNGVDFLKQVKVRQPDAVRLMLSASSDFETVVNAVNEAEVFRYISKPWLAAELEEVIRLALARREQILGDRHLADEVRMQRGELTPQELEAKRLEEEEPGITKVKWGPDGSVYFE